VSSPLLNFFDRVTSKLQGFFVPKIKYEITKIDKFDHLLRINLAPLPNHSPIRYYPGQYIYADFFGHKFQSHRHQCAISSKPSPYGDIKINIRINDNFSQKLENNILVGGQVLLDGPYGKMQESYLRNKDVVYIGSEAGIDQILAIWETVNVSYVITGWIQVIYVCDNLAEAIMDTDFRQGYAANTIGNQNQLGYTLWLNNISGPLSGNKIKELVDADLSDKVFVICGTQVFCKAILKELEIVGVKGGRVIVQVS
jgi:predicted ferric reductase